MEALKEELTNYCRENQISGVLRITHRDQILLDSQWGWADRARQLPFTADSMFTLYSMSKPFCAMGLLKLKDRELLDLDAHPARYLPEAAGFNPRVTVRQLLNHTSGIPDFEQTPEFAPFATADPARIRAQLPELAKFPQYFPPGTGGRYTNINYILAALIIENIAAMPYSEYMRREVFAPLGLSRITVDAPAATLAHRVCGYAHSEAGIQEVSKSDCWLLGAGDLVAPLSEVYALNLAVKHRLLLSRETWQEALTPSPINRKGLMGCTLDLWHGKPRIFHNGGHTGFRTLHIHLLQDDFDVIFLSNSGFGNARNDLAEIIHRHFYGAAPIAGAMDMDTGYIPRL